MLDLAKSIIGGALGVGAALLVLWVIGVATVHPTPAGLTAVGAGIHQVLSGFAQIVSGL